MSLLSDPLTSAGLLLAFAGLVLVLGLALQAWADRRRRGIRPSLEEPARVDGSDRGCVPLTTAEEPVTNDELPEGRRWVEEFAAQIEDVEPQIPTAGEPVTNGRLQEDRLWVEALVAGIEVVEAKLALADDSVRRTLRLVDSGGKATPGQTDSELSSHEEGADTVRADPDRGREGGR